MTFKHIYYIVCLSVTYVILVCLSRCVLGQSEIIYKKHWVRRRPKTSECRLGEIRHPLNSTWHPNLGPPFGVWGCVQCQCVPVHKKRRIVARVSCRNIKTECPAELPCPEPILPKGKCCKSCPTNAQEADENFLKEESLETLAKDKKSQRDFAVLLNGRASLTPVTSPSLAVGRLSLRKGNIQYSLVVSQPFSNPGIKPALIRFMSASGDILEEFEESPTPFTGGGRICGTWTRVPRQYRSLLLIEDLWLWLYIDSWEDGISGKISRYNGVNTEIFSALLAPIDTIYISDNSDKVKSNTRGNKEKTRGNKGDIRGNKENIRGSKEETRGNIRDLRENTLNKLNTPMSDTFISDSMTDTFGIYPHRSADQNLMKSLSGKKVRLLNARNVNASIRNSDLRMQSLTQLTDLTRFKPQNTKYLSKNLKISENSKLSKLSGSNLSNTKLSGGGLAIISVSAPSDSLHISIASNGIFKSLSDTNVSVTIQLIPDRGLPAVTDTVILPKIYSDINHFELKTTLGETSLRLLTRNKVTLKIWSTSGEQRALQGKITPRAVCNLFFGLLTDTGPFGKQVSSLPTFSSAVMTLKLSNSGFFEFETYFWGVKNDSIKQILVEAEGKRRIRVLKDIQQPLGSEGWINGTFNKPTFRDLSALLRRELRVSIPIILGTHALKVRDGVPFNTPRRLTCVLGEVGFTPAIKNKLPTLLKPQILQNYNKAFSDATNALTSDQPGTNNLSSANSNFLPANSNSALGTTNFKSGNSTTSVSAAAWVSVDDDCIFYYDVQISIWPPNTPVAIWSLYIQDQDDRMFDPRLPQEFSPIEFRIREFSTNSYFTQLNKITLARLQLGGVILIVDMIQPIRIQLSAYMTGVNVPYHCRAEGPFPSTNQQNNPNVNKGVNRGGTCKGMMCLDPIAPVPKSHNCVDNDLNVYIDGTTWPNPSQTCGRCLCSKGEIKCYEEPCPKAPCPQPQIRPGQCCPSCRLVRGTLSEQVCRLSTSVHVLGATWHPFLAPTGFDTCVTCFCNLNHLQLPEVQCERTPCQNLACNPLKTGLTNYNTTNNEISPCCNMCKKSTDFIENSTKIPTKVDKIRDFKPYNKKASGRKSFNLNIRQWRSSKIDSKSKKIDLNLYINDSKSYSSHFKMTQSIDPSIRPASKMLSQQNIVREGGCLERKHIPRENGAVWFPKLSPNGVHGCVSCHCKDGLINCYARRCPRRKRGRRRKKIKKGRRGRGKKGRIRKKWQ